MDRRENSGLEVWSLTKSVWGVTGKFKAWCIFPNSFWRICYFFFTLVMLLGCNFFRFSSLEKILRLDVLSILQVLMTRSSSQPVSWEIVSPSVLLDFMNQSVRWVNSETMQWGRTLIVSVDLGKLSPPYEPKTFSFQTLWFIMLMLARFYAKMHANTTPSTNFFLRNLNLGELVMAESWVLTPRTVKMSSFLPPSTSHHFHFTDLHKSPTVTISELLMPLAVDVHL